MTRCRARVGRLRGLWMPGPLSASAAAWSEPCRRTLRHSPPGAGSHRLGYDEGKGGRTPLRGATWFRARVPGQFRQCTSITLRVRQESSSSCR